VIAARLLRAFRQTRYTAAGVVVRIGRRDRLRPRVAVFITAWNPRSRRMPEGWNRRMQLRLCERLRRYRTLPADGALHRWHEQHLLVVADPRPVLRLARLFRQYSVVISRRGQPARLVLL